MTAVAAVANNPSLRRSGMTDLCCGCAASALRFPERVRLRLRLAMNLSYAATPLLMPPGSPVVSSISNTLDTVISRRQKYASREPGPLGKRNLDQETFCVVRAAVGGPCEPPTATPSSLPSLVAGGQCYLNTFFFELFPEPLELLVLGELDWAVVPHTLQLARRILDVDLHQILDRFADRY